MSGNAPQDLTDRQLVLILVLGAVLLFLVSQVGCSTGNVICAGGEFEYIADGVFRCDFDDPPPWPGR